MKVKLKIYRSHSETNPKSHYDVFEIEAVGSETVLDMLTYIQQNLDPGLAFRVVCRNMKCGECGVLVNKTPCLACEQKIEPEMTIRPLANLPVIRDLVIDREKIFKQILNLTEAAQLFKGNIELKDVKTHLKLTNCMECLICQSVCPVYKKDPEGFIGPLGLLWLAQRNVDLADDNTWVKEVHSQIEKCIDCGICAKFCALHMDHLNLAIKTLQAAAGSKAKG